MGDILRPELAAYGKYFPVRGLYGWGRPPRFSFVGNPFPKSPLKPVPTLTRLPGPKGISPKTISTSSPSTHIVWGGGSG